jgi:hypothetical protein
VKLYAVFAAPVLLACALVAQESAELMRGPDAGMSSKVHGITVRPATGRPFSARDYVKCTRNLENGTPVTTYLFANLARDSQGRIYREAHSLVSTNNYRLSKRTDIVVLDPVAHTRITCSVKKRHCLISDYHSTAWFKPMPAGSIENGTRFLSRESLGTDVIEGLKVIGTRETVSMNPGLFVKEPLVSTREFWYSPELQVNLSVTRKDPTQSTQVVHVEDLSRAEPDPAMFRMPEGYTFSKRDMPNDED